MTAKGKGGGGGRGAQVSEGRSHGMEWGPILF